MSGGVRPLDFAELCSNYSTTDCSPPIRHRHSSYSSSSSYGSDAFSSDDDDTGYHGDKPGYHADDVLYHARYREELTPESVENTDDFYRASRAFHSSSSISSDFQQRWLSVDSVSTALSDIIDINSGGEPLYENQPGKRENTYQIPNKFPQESTYENLRHQSVQYENFKKPKEYENWKPKIYENLRLKNLPKRRRNSASDHYQTPRPLSSMEPVSRYQIPGRKNFTSSCLELRKTPKSLGKTPACSSHLKSASLGFDPCAREEMLAPPSYSESVDNLKTMRPCLSRSTSFQSITRQGLSRSDRTEHFNQNLPGIQRSTSTDFQGIQRSTSTDFQGIQRSTSTNFHDTRRVVIQDYNQPLQRCSSQQISTRPDALHVRLPDSKGSNLLETFSSHSPSISRSLQYLSKLLDERFMGHQIPSEESLCRLRFPSNTQSANLNCDTVSRDESLANKSSGVESLANESSCCISSPGSCKPWEVETISLDSGVPLTSEDNECRTPEIVAQMYNQPDVLRVLEEERKRLRLIEDVGPYVGSLARRDKRRRPDVKRDSFQHKAKDFSPPPRMSKDSGSKGKASGAEFMSKTRDFTSRTRDSAALSSSANSLESQGLKRSHTVCASGSGDIHSYLRSKCSRDIASSRDDGISFKRHSKSTFDSGFESGLSDILDEILGGANYDPVLEESASPKTKWQSFKGKLIEAFAKSKKSELNDSGSDSSEVKATKWDKLQQFVKVKVAKVSHQDLDMGGFEDAHWRTLEPRQFHRGTRKTQSFVKWNRGGSR